MRCFTGTACGKAILLGEHAVVYGRPALGVPLRQIHATAEACETHGANTIVAADLSEAWALDDLPAAHGIGHIVRATLAHLGAPATPRFRLTLCSTIPMARGLGSGTAISTAIVRALAGFYGATLAAAEVSALVFETERLYHGTPSGIDNTIIAYEAPVYFVRGTAPQTLNVARSFRLVVGDTGVPGETKVAVGDVRSAWQDDPARYERIFDAIAALVEEARTAIQSGKLEGLGALVDANQEHLRELGVSSRELERLIAAAKGAGAAGAKLSGGGRGGCMLALVTAENEAAVSEALRAAGARMVMGSEVSWS